MSDEIYGIYCSAFNPEESLIETNTDGIANFLGTIRIHIKNLNNVLISSIAEIVERDDKLTITTKRVLTKDEQKWLFQKASDVGYLGVAFETGAFTPSITTKQINEFQTELGLRFSDMMGGNWGLARRSLRHARLGKGR
jgi:hypothetical protein